MRVRFIDDEDVEEGDALSRPPTDAGERSTYSEWHHFTLNDDRNGLYGIFNLALGGDVRDARQARAGVSLVLHQAGKGWCGTMNLHAFEDARFTPGEVALGIGGNSVEYRKDRYFVRGALKDGSIAINATWTPRAAALRVDNLAGVINTFIVPSLRVDGTLCVRGREYRLDGATGYHDHNWGRWQWGGGLAWHWGYIIQPPVRMAGGRRTHDDALSLVYGQVSNGVGAATRHDHALGVWTGKRCRQIFFDDAVRITSSGTLTGTTVPRVPGVVALLSPGRPHDVPRQIAIHAHDGDDSVDIELDVDGAMQFLIPRPDDIGSTTITELVGQYTVRTMLSGSGSEFSYRGFAEVAR